MPVCVECGSTKYVWPHGGRPICSDCIHLGCCRLRGELGPGAPAWVLASYGGILHREELARIPDDKLLAITNLGPRKLRMIRNVVPYQGPADWLEELADLHVLPV